MTVALPRQRPTTIESRRALFEEAAAIVALEYPDQLELDALARRLATSPRQLQRAFAEVGQTKFSTHLREVRMTRAGELLREGSLRVWEWRRQSATASRPSSQKPSVVITGKRLRRFGPGLAKRAA